MLGPIHLWDFERLDKVLRGGTRKNSPDYLLGVTLSLLSAFTGSNITFCYFLAFSAYKCLLAALSYVLVTKNKQAHTWSFILWNGLGSMIAAIVCPLAGIKVTLFDLNIEGMISRPENKS